MRLLQEVLGKVQEQVIKRKLQEYQFSSRCYQSSMNKRSLKTICHKMRKLCILTLLIIFYSTREEVHYSPCQAWI